MTRAHQLCCLLTYRSKISAFIISQLPCLPVIGQFSRPYYTEFAAAVSWFAPSFVTFVANVNFKTFCFSKILTGIETSNDFELTRFAFHVCQSFEPRLVRGIYYLFNWLIWSDFQMSVVKPKSNQLLTNWTTQPISNRSKTKTKTKVIAWLLSTLNLKPLCLLIYLFD